MKLLCIDCKHHKISPILKLHKCTYVMEEYIDLVTGENGFPNGADCSWTRAHNRGCCNPEGRFFEARIKLC